MSKIIVEKENVLSGVLFVRVSEWGLDSVGNFVVSELRYEDNLVGIAYLQPYYPYNL